MRWTLLFTLLLVACNPPGGSELPSDYVLDGPERVILLGDSITAGARNSDVPRDEVVAYDNYSVWSDLITTNDPTLWPDAESLGAHFPTVGEWHNLAVPGAQSTDVAGEQLAELLALMGDRVWGQTIVLITVGGNDLTDNGYDAGLGVRTGESVAENLAKVHAALSDTDRFPDGVLMYTANVYDPTGEGTGEHGGGWEAPGGVAINQQLTGGGGK